MAGVRDPTEQSGPPKKRLAALADNLLGWSNTNGGETQYGPETYHQYLNAICIAFGIDTNRARDLDPADVRAVFEVRAAEGVVRNFINAATKEQRAAAFEHYQANPGPLRLVAQMRRAQENAALDAGIDELTREGAVIIQAEVERKES